MLRVPLPSQHLAYHQWQTTTQHPPSTNSPSPCSTLKTTSPSFTRRQPTSSISNLTSNYKDSYHHPRQPQGPSTTRPGNSLPPTSGRNRKSFDRSTSSSNRRRTATATSSNYLRKRQATAGIAKPGKRNHLRYDNDDFDDPYDGIPETCHNMET